MERVAPLVASKPYSPPSSKCSRLERRLSLGGRSALVHDPEDPVILGGRALEPSLQSEMGSRFAHDFSRVRVHDDGAAHASASSYGAAAYTRGSNIFFGEGAFAPERPNGRRLLAHELAHVVQQSGTPDVRGSAERLSEPGEPPETEAQKAAEAVMDCRNVSIRERTLGPGLIQRDKKAPTSMSVATVHGPTAANCGGFSWKVNFKLPSASPAGGYFIQDLQIARSGTDCAGVAKAAAALKYHYWEAWHVPAGGVQDELVADGTFDFADEFALDKQGAGTKGKLSYTGSVAFYEGLALPASFIVKNPATIAGDLPSTATAPTLSGGTAAKTHSLSATWECCPKETATVISSHTP